MKNPLNLHFVSLLGHFNNCRTELLDTLKTGIETTRNLFCRKRKTKVAAENDAFHEDLYFLQTKNNNKITKTIMENARTNILKNS